jgi:formate dehydrogenase maturation protein FdhE
MEKKARCIEVRTSEGKVILSLYLFDKEMVLEDNPISVEKKPEAKEEKGQAGSSQADEPLMTSAQKRYLFRILAEQGFEGDKAHNHLKSLFQVESLKEVSKLEASRMIERLLEEAKGGKDDGSPF